MAVEVPIKANPDAVTRAMSQIRDAMRRSTEAGKEFASVNLGHPELKELIDDLNRLHGTLGRVNQVSRTTQYMPGGPGGRPGMYAPGPPPRQAAPGAPPAQTNPPGTYPAPPSPPAQPGGGGGGGNRGGGGGGGGGGGMLGGIMGGAASFALGTIALAGITGIKDTIARAIHLGQGESMSADDTYRRLTAGTSDFVTFRDAVRDASKGLQLTYQESQRLSSSWAKLTNDSSPEAITAGVRAGAGFARAYGMDVGMGTQGLGQAQYMGMDPSKFAGLVAETMQQGGQTGQVEQVMQSLLHWSESATRLLVTHSNIVPFAGMYAGLNATDLPGFKGGNAEAFIGQLNSSVMRGGNAGPASMALNYRVGRSLGVSDPYELRYLQQGGMFATAATDLGHGSGKTVFQAQMDEMRKMYPGQRGQPNYRLWNAMENQYGINMRQAMAFDTSFHGNADLGGTARALKSAGLNISDLNPTSIRDVAAISSASPEGLQGWRKTLLGRTGSNALNDAERSQLQGASGADLRNLLIQLSARHGMEETEGTQTRQAMADLNNSLTKIGADLVPPLNAVKEGLASVGGALGDLTTVMKNVYLAGQGDEKAKAALLGTGQSVMSMPTKLSSEDWNAAAQSGMNYFQSEGGGGWSHANSAGIVEQAAAESGFDPRAQGDKVNGVAQAHGAFQWHPDRRRAIEEHYFKKYGVRKSVLDMTLQEQFEMKAWEISPQGPEAAAGAKLRTANTTYMSGAYESMYDERPAGGLIEANQRGAGAAGLGVRFGPLEVVHKDSSGRELKRENLPVTAVPRPTPWGMD